MDIPKSRRRKSDGEAGRVVPAHLEKERSEGWPRGLASGVSPSERLSVTRCLIRQLMLRNNDVS